MKIDVDEHGHVAATKILTAPSEADRRAILAAAGSWRFRTDQTGAPMRFTGKVTFYFLVGADGKGIVSSPENTPYLGYWAEASVHE